MPSVAAFTGVSNPTKVITASDLNFALAGSASRSLTITITETGILQAFQCIINAITIDTSVGNSRIVMSRNGNTINVQSIDIGAFNATQDAGVLFYETMSMLSGSTFNAGETITVTITNDASIVNTQLDMIMNAVIAVQPKSFIIP